MEQEFRHYWTVVEQIHTKINIYDSGESYLQSLEEVRPELGRLYAAHLCQSEVCNGGFEQFFFDSSGILAPEAVEGFEAIGQESIALLVKGALEKFGEPYPRERFDRVAILDDMDEETAETLTALEENFFDLIGKEAGGFEAAADRYAASILGEQR